MTFLFVCSLFSFIFASEPINVSLNEQLQQLQKSYPEHIKEIGHDYILWADGEKLSIYHQDTHNITLADQLKQPGYLPNITEPPIDDPGRVRCELFFKKMYGNSPQEVEQQLTTIDWMPRIFGFGTYQLKVTLINNVHAKLQAISDELEELAIAHPEYIHFLKNPGGTYDWRFIANTTRLSNHSFGMTIDINASATEYWQWDLKKQGKEISEEVQLTYKNSLPWEIVLVFEKYGFIWGGKWYHYDTMHFEYRPELFLK